MKASKKFIVLRPIGLLKSETTNTKVTGPVLFSWKYISNSRWGFGILAGHDNRGKKVSPGIYLYRLTANEFVETKRMILHDSKIH